MEHFTEPRIYVLCVEFSELRISLLMIEKPVHFSQPFILSKILWVLHKNMENGPENWSSSAAIL